MLILSNESHACGFVFLFYVSSNTDFEPYHIDRSCGTCMIFEEMDVDA